MRSIGIVPFLAPFLAPSLACILTAQTPPPPVPLETAALVSGVLLECDARPSGEFSIRAADNRVLRYQFDRKTYVEREDRLIEAARLAAGEKVEVLSDTVAGYTAALRQNHPRHQARPAASSPDARQAARLRSENRARRPRRKYHLFRCGFPRK